MSAPTRCSRCLHRWEHCQCGGSNPAAPRPEVPAADPKGEPHYRINKRGETEFLVRAADPKAGDVYEPDARVREVCEDCEERPVTERYENGAEVCGVCSVRREVNRMSATGRAAYLASLASPPSLDAVTEEMVERAWQEQLRCIEEQQAPDFAPDADDWMRDKVRRMLTAALRGAK